MITRSELAPGNMSRILLAGQSGPMNSPFSSKYYQVKCECTHTLSTSCEHVFRVLVAVCSQPALAVACEVYTGGTQQSMFGFVHPFPALQVATLAWVQVALELEG